MTDNLSLADIAAVTDKNDCGMWGGNSAWIIIFLIFAMMGGGGFWGGNGVAAATTADIQRAVDLNAIQRGQADIAADIQRTTYETIGAVKDAAYNNLSETRDVQAAAAAGFTNISNILMGGFAEQQKCCCETNRNIDSVKFDMANYAAAMQAEMTKQTQRVLDTMNCNKMSEMQARINQLETANVINAATAGVVKYPMATTYSSGVNPFCGGAGSGCCGQVAY
mgnify:FL=1